MNDITIKDYTILEQYRKTALMVLERSLPQVPKKELNKFIKKRMEDTIHNPQNVQLHNNYVNKRIEIDLLTLTQFIQDNRPIIAGGGTLFKNQELESNPNAKMLDVFMQLRKEEKKKLKIFQPATFEYNQADLNQQNEKVNANAFYGCNGAKTSRFFNIYTAAAVTTTGQALISTTEQAFEAFLSGGYKYASNNEVFMFMTNVIKEKKKTPSTFLADVAIPHVVERLKNLFYSPEDCDEQSIFNFLMGCTQDEINRIFYKNNLYVFCSLPKIFNIIERILVTVDEFIDPNKVPESIQKDVKKFYSYIQEFVLYNHSSNSRVNRVKTDTRQSVAHVDTDSNMIYLYPWVEFCFQNVIEKHDKAMNRGTEMNVFIAINTMAYVLTSMVTDVLSTHTDRCNVLSDYKDKINMKNEFLFIKMGFTDKKKRYFAGIVLREGKVISPYKMDIKGLDFMKSTTRAKTKKEMTDMVAEKIIEAEDISVPDIFAQLEQMGLNIIDSLKSKSKEYLIPASVKEVEAYKDPMRISQYKATYVWNCMFPSNEIQLPAKVDVAKVNMQKLEDIEGMKETMPEQYKNLKEKIFEGPIKSFNKGGITRIAVPSGEIPDWLLDYIDYEGIANDNVSRFMPVAKALGINVLSTTRANYYTNILDF